MPEHLNQPWAILDAMPILVWIAGPDRRCVFFNKRWQQFAGSDGKPSGGDWLDRIHPHDRPRCASVYAKAFAQHEEFQFECRLRRADGGYCRMLAKGAPRFTATGAFAGFAGAITQAGEQHHSANHDGAGNRRLSSIGTLAAGIAHDFNNLLASILANAELALTELPAQSNAIAELERIRTVAVRGAEIVREMMVYVGQEQPRAEAIDLSKLVEEMLEMLRISVTKHARITTELAMHLPAVIADAAEIRELLMNLILNSSEALGENDGEIRISTSQASAGCAKRTAGHADGGDCVRLIVADTGPGIPAPVRRRIFDPFVTTKHSGRGVGLAIVRTIARKYGGTVRIASAPGRGTRFTVLLPSSAAHVAPAQNPAAVAATRGTVLLVDDEEGLRLAVSLLLQQSGFRVIEAKDGSTALEQLRAHRRSIDTILLDLTLPGTPSSKIIEEATRIHPGVRILLTSAYSLRNGGSALHAPQVQGFVRKPYQIRELLRMLDQAGNAAPVSAAADGR